MPSILANSMDGPVVNVKCEAVKTVDLVANGPNELVIKAEPEDEEELLDLNDFEVEKWNQSSEDEYSGNSNDDENGDDSAGIILVHI